MSAIGELIKTIKSGGVCLDEYNGNYGIMSAWVNREGEIKPNMCKIQFKDEEKRVALKITLGNKERAIEVLKSLLEQITELPVFIGEQAGDGSDVPF